MIKFDSEVVKNKYDQYPVEVKKKMLQLRDLILKVAVKTQGVGKIDECLKWGELSFITIQSKSGSTFRIDWKAKDPKRYHIYFNCRTKLLAIFRQLYPNDFDFAGNRSISFKIDERIPKEKLAKCIEIALTYNANGYKDFFK